MADSPDWRAYVNRLVFCYGCGRFGMPKPKTGLPNGWSTLYQPHGGEAPTTLQVCSGACKSEVREAMAEGPIFEPIHEAIHVLMPASERAAMMAEIKTEIEAMLAEEAAAKAIAAQDPPTQPGEAEADDGEDQNR